jgi:chromosome segregation ATPase
MGEAADKLEKNQMGQARERQEQARNELRDLMDTIQNRRERELARLVKELKNAEAELAQTRAKQAQNLKKTREVQQNPDANQRREQLKKLAKEQAEIQRDLKRQLQKLAKLSADRAARAGQSASGKMSRAQENLDDDQGENAGKEQEEALANLEDAQDELEETRRDAEEQLAVEQLARMGDQLKSLAERQEKIVSETASYEAQRRKNNDRLTLGQRASIKGLGEVQSGLKDETGELIEKLDGAPVFALTLRRASQSMEVVAKRLQETKTDKSTEDAARSASDRFKQLVESLKADAAGGGQGGGGGGGGGGAGAGGANGNGDGIPPTAQLKLLKTLQQEINDRTEALDEKKRRNQKLSPEQTTEIQQLGEEQGVLADLVRDMTRPKRDDGEE